MVATKFTTSSALRGPKRPDSKVRQILGQSTTTQAGKTYLTIQTVQTFFFSTLPGLYGALVLSIDDAISQVSTWHLSGFLLLRRHRLILMLKTIAAQAVAQADYP